MCTWTRMQCASPLWVCISGNTSIGRWSGCHGEQWAQKTSVFHYAWINVCVSVCMRVWTGKLGVKLWWRLWRIFISTLTVVLTHTLLPLFLYNRLEKKKNVCVHLCACMCLHVSSTKVLLSAFNDCLRNPLCSANGSSIDFMSLSQVWSSFLTLK